MKRRLTVLGIVVLNLFLLLGCGEKGEEATILANKELWKDNENLYEIPMEELEGVKQSTVYRVGDDLLFAYDTYDEEKGKSVYELKLVSITSFAITLGALRTKVMPSKETGTMSFIHML